MPKRLPLTAESQKRRYGEFPFSTTHKRNNGQTLRDPFPGRRVDGERAEFTLWFIVGLRSWSFTGLFQHFHSQYYGRIKEELRHRMTTETVYCWFSLAGKKKLYTKNEYESNRKIKSTDFKGKIPRAIPRIRRIMSLWNRSSLVMLRTAKRKEIFCHQWPCHFKSGKYTRSGG